MDFPDRISVGKEKHRQVFTLKLDHYMLEFVRGTPKNDINATLEKYKLANIQISISRSGDEFRKLNVSRQKPIRKWIKVEQRDDIADIGKLSIVHRTAPVYVLEGMGVETASAPVPNVLLIGFSSEPTTELINKIEKEFGLEHDSAKSELLGNTQYFVVKEPEDTVYSISESIAKLEGVSFVEFDWLIMEPLGFNPNDTYFDDQWHLEHISAIGGWDLETGDSSVIIAIIDTGCDLNHPDLQNNYVPLGDHFDSVEWENNDPTPYDAGPDGIWPEHGTCVAGIAAASINNGMGVAGIAGGCSIMPIYSNFSTTGQAASINWAVNHGANVISMSFGGYAYSATVETAVGNAHSSGLVLVACAHNHDNNTVTYPARYSEVICVGASDEDDERKRPASTDGENWGGNYGNDLDVMAPGVKIWTTDIQGANGYNNNNGGPYNILGVNYPSSGDAAGDYFALFGGTSAATPQVSGLAALLFSLYSTLTNEEVREIIERTCRKASPNEYDYVIVADRPNGSWHQEMGYGIISIYCALRYAKVYVEELELQEFPFFHELKELYGYFKGFKDMEIQIFQDVDPVPDIYRAFKDDKEKIFTTMRLRAEYGQELLKLRQEIIKLQLDFHQKIIKAIGL